MDLVHSLVDYCEPESAGYVSWLAATPAKWLRRLSEFWSLNTLNLLKAPEHSAQPYFYKAISPKLTKLKSSLSKIQRSSERTIWHQKSNWDCSPQTVGSGTRDQSFGLSRILSGLSTGQADRRSPGTGYKPLFFLPNDPDILKYKPISWLDKLRTHTVTYVSRYVLGNPLVSKGKKVLDLGSGCGAAAIAAQLCGAAHVVANDIDPGKKSPQALYTSST